MVDGAYKREGVEIVPLSKETLQDQVFRHVTELILDGSIVPGETVTVQSLADAFGVSPMPVREALRRLSSANALTVISGRSIGIPALSRKQLTDLRNVRFEVEGIAASWAAQKRSDTEIPEFSRHLAALEEANGAGDVKAYLRANYTFHFAIYRAARSEILLKIIKDLWLQVSPYFNMLHGSYTTANTYHQDMFAALRDKNAEAMRIAVCADIDAAYQVLMQRLVE